MFVVNFLIVIIFILIELIIEKVGFSNKIYFYFLYKKIFNFLFNEVRNKK